MICLKIFYVSLLLVFFFQAEDGIRDLVRSRGLGDVYKRQEYANFICRFEFKLQAGGNNGFAIRTPPGVNPAYGLSLIHI